MNRYIAFLDILGFGELVRNEPLWFVKERLKRALDWATAAARAAPQVGIDGVAVCGVRIFSFSDTFVIIAENESTAAFLSFLNATTVLTRALFAEKLPIRGAITFGEADFIDGTQHAVGKGIVAAAELEKRQDWLGVMVDEGSIPSEARPLMADVLFAPVFARWDVPCKSTDGDLKPTLKRDALVVNWLYNVRVNYPPESVFRQSSDPRARRKIENTLAFVRHVREAGMHKGRSFHLNPKGQPIFTPSLEGLGTASAFYGSA